MERDQGVTLIELLFVIVVLGLVAGVLGAAVTVSTRSASASRARLALAQDEQQLSSIVSRDLAQAVVVDTAEASGCVADPVLRINLGGVVAYRVDDGRTLVRVDCAADTERVVARNLAASPTVVCAPECGPEPQRVTLQADLCWRAADGSCVPGTGATVSVVARPRVSS